MNFTSILPDFEEKELIKLALEIKSNFNPEFYLQTAGISGKHSLKHYLTDGWKQGFDPNPDFSTKKYLETHTDVSLTNQNPLVHYIAYGRNECRVIFPSSFKKNYKPKEDAIRTLDKPVTWSQSLENILTSEHIDLINKNELFSYSFYYRSYPDVYLSGQDGFLHYINHGWIENRNPSQVFDTLYYKKEYRDVTACPFIHYVTAGINEGRRATSRHTLSLQEKTIQSAKGYKTESRIAVHAHIFYPELGEEIINACNKIPFDFSLFITTNTSANADYLSNLAKKTSNALSIESISVKNKGRDIAPMLVGMRHIWEEYDYVCHIHSKKSLHTNFGERWRAYTLDQLLGSADLISAIIRELDDNPLAGVVFPDNFLDIKNFVEWGDNLAPAERLFEKMGLPSYHLKNTWEFPAGSMCWIRSDSLRPLLDLELSLVDFEEENKQVEGTLAHVIERCLIHISSSRGYEYIKYLAAPQDYNKIVPASNLASSLQHPSKPKVFWQPLDPAISINPRRSLEPLSSVFNAEHLNIHWIIPEFVEGLGGHTTIFRFVRNLELFGHHQTVWILNPHVHADEQEAKLRVQEWFQPIGENVTVRFLPEEVDGISGDAVISTDAWTVYPALAMPLFKERFYFVQDHEPSFYPRGTTYHLVENTYKFGLKTLCAGSWLEGLMVEKYSNWARKWYLAYDESVYFPSVQSHGSRKTTKIAFYSRFSTPRRNVEIGLLALELLSQQGLNFEVHLFGNDSPVSAAFPHINHGVLKPEALGDLYRECDIGMVFSATNYSLIPIEMMACDLPVVEVDTESTRAVFDESCVCFSLPDPVHLAKTLQRLILDQGSREALINGGRSFIKDISWEASARIVESALIEGLAENASPIKVNDLLATKNNNLLKASIIIPTYNAGATFESVLRMVVSQKTPWDYEIVIVDSGSTDETIATIQKFPEIKLHRISNDQFQHGKTRNLAINLTKGEFIAVITQDALPVDSSWLNNLIDAFDKSDKIAGVYGRHLPYPNASDFVKRDIINHFDHYNMLPHVVSLKRGLPSFVQKSTDHWQQLMHFFSDNNACLRRSVWEKIPYPEIDWGEDQTWAWEILKLGFEKAYAHDAVVYHSHTLTYKQQLKISMEEGKFFAKYFNYYPVDSREQMHSYVDDRNLRDTQFSIENQMQPKLLSEQKNLNKAAVSGIFIGSQTHKFSKKGSL